MYKPRIAVASALLLFAGTALADGPITVPEASADAGVRAVQVISLRDAVGRAMASNPNAVTAIEEIRRADALTRQARSAALPTLYGNGVYTHLDSERGTTVNGVTSVVAYQDTINANLTLALPLIAPRAWVGWGHAGDNADVTRLSAEAIKQQIAVSTARAYLAVLAEKRVIAAEEHALTASKAHFDFANTRFQGGVGNRLDAVRAAQDVASTESTLAQLRSTLARDQEALGVLVGTDGALDVSEEPDLSSVAAGANVADIEKNRRDVVEARRKIEAADRVVHDAWADYTPYLTGFGEPLYQSRATTAQPVTGWQAQLVLVLPLYDGGLRYGQQDERKALRDEARTALEGTLRQARADVRTAFEEMRRADEALATARDAFRLAQEALNLATLAYKAGATTNIEVIDAEKSARDAETAVAVAEDGARQARLDLLAATGRFP